MNEKQKHEIRKATLADAAQIESAYNEHFEYELAHGAFTVFKKGVYPTRTDAEKAIGAGSLYVYDAAGEIAGSIIVNSIQPPEYGGVAWQCGGEAMAIHLLMVRPCMAGEGIASALMEYAEELAKANACKALRLDTGSQNAPALSLYKKLGFRVAAAAPMKVGDAIEHREHLFLEKVL